MTGEPDLVGLLHRADWAGLSMAAELSDGSTVLVAPGRRYRVWDGERLEGCDGERPWQVAGDELDESVHWVSGPEPPLRTLLCPSWLLVSSQIEVRGPVNACGRDGLDIVMTRRPSVRDTITPHIPYRVDRVEAVVDAELGILLRAEETYRNGTVKVTELVSLDLDPVIDPEQFTPPPGSLIGERIGEALSAGGPAWWAMKSAAGLAAGGLGALIKYSPQRRGRPEHPEAEIPADGGDPANSGTPVGNDVLHRLHRSGTAGFGATMHQWVDVGAMLSGIPAGARRAGLGGLGLFADAVSERSSVVHKVSTVRIAGPNRYRVDHADPSRDVAKTIVCDGQRRWQVYDDKVMVSATAQTPGDVADLADASWLLECGLTGGELVMVGDRPGYRVGVARGDALWSMALMFGQAMAVVDAELGVLLRLTCYLRGKPVQRMELRDLTAGAGDFPVDIPPDLPVVEETRAAPYGGNVPLNIAGAVAKETAKAARNFLNSFNRGRR